MYPCVSRNLLAYFAFFTADLLNLTRSSLVGWGSCPWLVSSVAGCDVAVIGGFWPCNGPVIVTAFCGNVLGASERLIDGSQLSQQVQAVLYLSVASSGRGGDRGGDRTREQSLRWESVASGCVILCL
jgi:hypothetical protein